MSITVRDALKIGGFTQCKLLGGENGLDNPIEYAGTMEIPDIKFWLIKNQLLVTTGYPIKDEPYKITSLIQDLYDMDCSALAIKTRFTGPIPQEAIDLANKLNIPLIEIPPSIHFLDLLPMVIQAISMGHTRLLEFSQNVQHKFAELDSVGGGAQNISNMVSNLLLASVQITTASFYPLCSTKKDDLDTQYIFPLFLSQQKSLIDDFSKSEQNRFYWMINKMDLNYIARKIIIKDKTLGYILTCSKSPPNELTNIVMDHAAAVMALEFSKLQNTKEQRRIMATNLFTDILSGNIKNEDEIIQRAGVLNWTEPPLSLIVFDVNDFVSLAQVTNEVKLQEIKNLICDLIGQQFFPNIDHPSIIVKSDSFTCLISSSYKKELLTMAIENIILSAKSQINLTLSAGIVMNIKSYTEISIANSNARDAIKICRLKNSQKNYAFADDVLIEQALLHMKSNPYMHGYIEKTISKLEKYDVENNGELVHTLEVLIDCMGVRTKAAELLFMHRNTLMYRIKRIEDLTECNLNSPQEIFSLGLALKIKKYSHS